MTTTSNSSTASTTPPHSKSGSMKRSATMSITKDLEDNVTAILGPNTKITFKSMLKLEIKSDKHENRLLVFTTFRLYIFNCKGAAKLETSYNYVDVSSIESSNPSRLILGFQNETRHCNFQSCDPSAEEINTIIVHLCTTLKTLFPHCPLEMFVRRLDVEPTVRLSRVYEYVATIDEKARYGALDLPCGGFSSQYSCFCDFYGVQFREEVAWDIDTIYASQGGLTAELSIVDFEHLESRDLAPIIAALAYNGYFRKFRVSNVKISGQGHSSSGGEQICDLILNLVRKSASIEEIYLDSTGIRTDFVNKLFQAAVLNPKKPLKVIDLSGNGLEDKGLRSLVQYISPSGSSKNASDDSLKNSMAHSMLNELVISSPSMVGVDGCLDTANIRGLTHLNLSKCSISSKGINELAEALYTNKSMLSTLSYLNLSDNSFKDDLNKLCNFFAQQNSLTTLDLSGTDCSLEALFGALLHGCTQSLVHLNLAHNQYTSKKSSHKADQVIPSAIKQFFKTAISLRTVNLSHNKLPAEVLKNVLLGLSLNKSATDIRINLASNDFKGPGGSVLEAILSDVHSVSALDLSDNSLEMDLSNIIRAISKNKSIKFLSIGRNFSNIKPKNLPKTLDAFVQVLQEPDCALESLSLADSKLRAETSMILNALGSNQSLVNVDVSGNAMGLTGARTLAKALQVNTKLETIYLDRNLITTQGFFELSYALERNFTLKYLPIPIQDAQQAMLKTPERTEAAINKIQESIRRNNLPQTALLRSVKLAGSARSTFLVDTNLFSHIERNLASLRQALNSGNHVIRSVEQSQRFPSIDSLDIQLSDNEKDCLDIDPEGLLQDAIHARGLCTKIQEVYTSNQTVNGFSSFQDSLGRRFSSITIARPIEANIQEFAKELKKTFEAQIVAVSELMISKVKQEFCHVFRASKGRLEADLKELYMAMLNGAQMPPTEYFHLCLTESGSSTWSSKLESVLHQIAAQMCNRVLIEIGRCLSDAHKNLTGAGHSGGGSLVDYAGSGLPVINGSNGRSVTPSSLWIHSGSPDSNDITNIERHLAQIDGDANNAIATPKQQNQRRQNVYLPKLRPQSVLDGTMANSDEISTVTVNTSTSQDVTLTGSLLNTDDSISAPAKSIQHLTKMRPKPARKTRAPTRVQIVDSSTTKSNNLDGSGTLSQSPQLDEGLDSFFSSSSSSAGFINKRHASASQNSLIGDGTPPALPAKPKPQPRKILRNFGFKQTFDQGPEVGHVSLKSDSTEFVRTISPTPPFSKHVSLCSDPEGLIPARTVSPLPVLVDEQVHSEILAEMRAKQEAKRSHASTPQDPNLTFAAGLVERRISPVDSVETNNNNVGTSIAKRATIFGELKKSPSRGSINVGSGNGNNSGDDISPPSSASISGPRQRPKSVVGLLSAKFEVPNYQ